MQNTRPPTSQLVDPSLEHWTALDHPSCKLRYPRVLGDVFSMEQQSTPASVSQQEMSLARTTTE